jgi:DNA-binding NtrC family response regulator
VGSDREVEVDLRVVSATHQDLSALATEGEFREDLFGRLSGLVIELLGLVERREEILPLFLAAIGSGAPPLSPAAAEALLTYRWPRNVRELEHAAAAVKLFVGSVAQIDLPLLPSAIQRVQPSSEPLDAAPDRARLVALLTEHAGNVAQVARALNAHRQQVYRWLEAQAIDAASYRRQR